MKETPRSGVEQNPIPRPVNALGDHPDLEGLCRRCGKANPSPALFCDKCGSRITEKTQPKPSFSEWVFTSVWNRSQIILHASALLWQKIAAYPLRKAVLTTISQVPSRTVAKVALIPGVALAFVLLSGFAGMQASCDGALDHPASWQETRQFVSNRLRLSIDEVNVLARLAWRSVPKDSASVSAADARRLEKVVQVQASRNIRLFWPPFHNEWLSVSHFARMDHVGESYFYPDLPTNHPVYEAWHHLIRLGTPLADNQGRANPYGPISWEEWNRASAFLLTKLLDVGEQRVAELVPPRTGVAGSDELRAFLGKLAQAADVSGEFVDSRWLSRDVPNRLRAFAALDVLSREIRKRHGS